MSEEGFLQAIRARPDDDVPRLVYADWLEMQGDPRAEFIRLQVGLAAGEVPETERSEWQAREAEWLRELTPQVREQLGPLGVKDVRWHRGFIEKIAIDGVRFLQQPRTLALAAPALRGMIWRNIPFGGAAAAFQKLTSLSEFSTLRSLDLSGNSINGAALSELVSKPMFATIQALYLGRNQVGGHGMQQLAASPYAGQLTTLHVPDNDLAAGDARVLARSKQLTALQTLNLNHNRIADDGLQAFAQADGLTSLEQLWVAMNDILGEGLRSLANSQSRIRWGGLDLSDSELGDTGLACLSSASNFSQLTTLKVARSQIGPEGLQRLAQTLYLRQLTTLDLEGNPLGRGVLHLIGTACLQRLKSLNLTRTNLDLRTAEKLLEALPTGLEVNLSGNGLEQIPTLKRHHSSLVKLA